MGWASGSGLLEEVAQAIMPLVAKRHRQEVARELITLFEMYDCDTICECKQEDIAKEFKRLNPEEE